MNLKVLDLSKLNENRKQAFPDSYNIVREIEPGPFSEEFASPKARRLTDEGISEVLTLMDWLRLIRRTYGFVEHLASALHYRIGFSLIGRPLSR